MSASHPLDDATDPEVEALNEALPEGQRGFYARHMDGDVMWHEAPDRERCGGHGWMECYCGGDFCVCGNRGEIECVGCEDCEGECDDTWEEDRTP
jgi:hypothetical protein